MLLLLDIDDLGRTICIAGVVEVPCLVSMEGGIYDILLVQTEKIAITDSLLLIDDFAFVCDLISDSFANILDHDITRS